MLEVVSEELAPGVVVCDRWRLDRKVGEGGMGVVWAGTHTATGKTCALKFLKGDRVGDPRSHTRLLREARAACAVRHPNVAEVHDVLELESGLPFLVMDLLEGETLAAKLERQKKLTYAELVDIFTQIIDGIAAAHAAGIVHRDLKPENVFLCEKQVKVLDFGIAKIDHATEPSVTTTGALVGTSFYMAPEQVYGARDADAAVDVWALGVMLYEAIVGERPIRGENVGEVFKAITRDPIPPLPKSTPLARIVRRMLSREPRERPSLDQVRAALVHGDSPRIWPLPAFFASVILIGGVAFAFRPSTTDEQPTVHPITSTPPEESVATMAPAPVVDAEVRAVATASTAAIEPKRIVKLDTIEDAGRDAEQDAATSSIILTHDRK